MNLEIALLLWIEHFKFLLWIENFMGFFYPRSEEEGISLSVGLAVRPYVGPFVTHFCRIFSATINCKGLKSKKNTLCLGLPFGGIYFCTPQRSPFW